MRSGSRFSVGSRVCLAGLVFLAIGVEARADVMRHTITYSTTGPEPMSGPTDAPVFEFRGVENGVAELGSAFKLGTFLIHQQAPNQGFMFDNSLVMVKFQVSAVDGAAVSPNESPVFIENNLSATVHPDGTVDGALATFSGVYSALDSLDPWKDARAPSFLVGDLKLSLAPIQWDGSLSNREPGIPVVEVDVYGRIDAPPVPEPGTWLVFIGAMGFFAGTRLRRAK